MLEIRDHAYQRAKQRYGWKKCTLDRMADRAYVFGESRKEVSSGIRFYFDKLYFDHKKANNIRLYGKYVFLFGDNRLITVLHLPRKYHKQIKDKG